VSYNSESSAGIFAYLINQPQTIGKLTVRPTGVKTSHGQVVHAVDESGFPSLMVPVEASDHEYVEWQNKAVTLRRRNLPVQGVTQTFLVLQSTSSRLLSQFSLLADDILEAVSAYPESAAMIMRQTVERWKEMLRDQKAPLLSEEQLIGLFGELLFLEELACEHGPLALHAWQGPNGGRHDFAFQNASVEVKTTTTLDTFTVTFHGTKQLEKPVDRFLYVQGYRVEPTIAGESVPQVLQRLFNLGISRLELLRLVEQLGYSETDANHYAERRFAVLSRRSVAVNGDFPRITSETISEEILHRISALRYQVDLQLQEESVLGVAWLELEEAPA
jgi:hypothetical protein